MLAKNKEADKAIKVAVNYYAENEDRMRYKTFKEQGYMIGSGPIESTRKKVVHQSMKLFGQRWSIKGPNSIANLRCYHLLILGLR